MKRTIRSAVVAVAALLGIGIAAPAHAGFGFGATAGYGVSTNHFTNGGSLEIIPSYSLAEIVMLDASVLLTRPVGLESTSAIFRPGVRVSPPFIPLYARLAVPLSFDPDGSIRPNLLGGLGLMIKVANLLLLAEVNGTEDMNVAPGQTAAFLAEARAGLQLVF